MLTRELRVRIDRTGQCDALSAYYEAVDERLQKSKEKLEQAFLATRPITLSDSTAQDCFSYSITYNVPLDVPVQWQRQLLTSVPLRLTMIHPIKDLKYFRHDEHAR